MDEKLSKLKEQISKIDDLKNVARWGSEYQLWMNKTEKLVGEIFGQDGLQLFQQQRTTTTSYIDESFNVRQYLKEHPEMANEIDKTLRDKLLSPVVIDKVARANAVVDEDEAVFED